MEFGNPIVGDEELIRSAIKSRDFTADNESGVSGWRIARDGSATFYNLTVGSNKYFIDESGNAVFNSVSANVIELNGMPLSEILDVMPRGIIAVSTITGSSPGYTGASQVLAGRIVIPNASRHRQYVIGGSRLHFDTQGSTGARRMNLDVRYAWNAPASTSTTHLWGHQESTYNLTSFDQEINFRHPFNVVPPNGEGVDDLHLALYFSSDDTSGMLRMIGSTGSRLYVEDIGALVSTSTFSLGTGTTPVQTYVKTYSANWSDSYQADGDKRGITQCYQGYYSSTNGNQYSLIGFPYSTIQADLANATITKVEVYLNNNHWYNNSGGTAVIGTHNYASEPTTASLSNVNSDITRASFTYGQAKWVTVSNSIGTALKGNTAKGIVLGPGPSNSNAYYGYFAGNGESGEPQIRITYTK